MKTVKRKLTGDNYYTIMSFLNNQNSAIETFESVLNDGGIYCGSNIKIGRFKPREYIVLIPTFETTNSDSFYIILTDSEKEAYKLAIQHLLN
mgnify:CR=1 FL=1